MDLYLGVIEMLEKFSEVSPVHPTQKPFATISEDMRRVVGERAAEFISDCSRWVRECCTLKTR